MKSLFTTAILFLLLLSTASATQLPFYSTNEYAGPENIALVKINPNEDLDPRATFLLGSPYLRPPSDSELGKNHWNRLLFWNPWRSTMIMGRVNNLNFTTNESHLQQWDPSIVAQYSFASGWDQIPYGGLYDATNNNTRGDNAKGQGMMGYQNRGGASYAQTLGQWNINMVIGGAILGRENSQGRPFYPWTNSVGRMIDVTGDVRSAFPTGEVAFVRNIIPGVSRTPWHAYIASHTFTNGITTITLDRTIAALAGNSGFINNAEPATKGSEPSPARDAWIIGHRSATMEDHQLALGYEARPPKSNEGAIAEATGAFKEPGDAQRVRMVLKSYPISVLTQYRFGPIGANNPIIPTNTTWAMRGTIMLRRVDVGRAVELSAAADFNGIFTRLEGNAIGLGNTITAYTGSSVPVGNFSVSGGSTGQIVVAVNIPALTTPEKSGDTGSLITSAAGITGLQYSTMDQGRVFVKFTDQGGGNYSAQIYQHASGSGLLAHTGNFTAAQNGNLALTTDNASGVGGNLNINGTNIAPNVGEESVIQMWPVMQGVTTVDVASTTGG